jgi:DNA-directed RNA polymerase specialized sigma24 family protein
VPRDVRIAAGRTLQGVSPPQSDTERFTLAFERCAARVFAYARRHTDRSAAEDVVAETFLVA